jgi:hypothetical protein
MAASSAMSMTLAIVQPRSKAGWLPSRDRPRKIGGTARTYRTIPWGSPLTSETAKVANPKVDATGQRRKAQAQATTAPITATTSSP